MAESAPIDPAGVRIAATLKAPAAWPLRDQLIRAAISVPSNIAEGAGRGTDPDFDRFLGYSLGSLNELEYDLLLAHDLRFLQADEHSQICSQLVEVRRMLSGLKAQLKT